MNYKKLLFSGIAIFLASNIIGFLVTFWGIRSSFSALEANETSGIGAVGTGPEMALVFTIIQITGTIIGIILMIVGGIKAYQQSKMQS